MLIVPDASVLLKWGFPGPSERDRDKAEEVLAAWLEGKADILLPRLWAFEMGNVLALKNPGHASEMMEVFLGYRFPEAETTPDLCREAFRLVQRCGVTFYDAAYHAVALRNGGTMLTADEAYYRKASGHGSVALLHEFGPA